MPATFHISPVFPVRDVKSALELYRRLGFDARAYDELDGGEPVYGFIDRGGIQLHVARVRDLDCAKNTSACYLYVDDANALHAEWKRAAVPGRLHDPEDTPYRLREFAYVDPDGNLIRVGSRI